MRLARHSGIAVVLCEEYRTACEAAQAPPHPWQEDSKVKSETALTEHTKSEIEMKDMCRNPGWQHLTT